MPLGPKKSTFYSCCSKVICDGCVYANSKSIGGDNCPFCREPAPDDDEEIHMRIMKRIKANDPTALRYMGTKHYEEGDWDSAVKYWAKAAELGDAGAHYRLGYMYSMGEGVVKDDEKKVDHLEKAATGGHPTARHNLGCIEWENGNIERAVKHFIIAANLGYESSMKSLWWYYSEGNVNKGELEATLRTHKAAIDATKSKQRDTGEAYYRQRNEVT